MKHIKLITLLSTSTVLASSLPIIASCSDGSNKVTKQEMFDALDKLTNSKKWNYTCKLVTKVESSETESYTQTFKFASNGIYAEEADENETYLQYIKTYKNRWFHFSYEATEKKPVLEWQYGANPLSSYQDTLEPFGLIAEILMPLVFTDKFVYNNSDKSYHVDATEEINAVLKFNSKKQLEHLIMAYKDQANDIESFDYTFSDYGTTADIVFPFKDTDVEYPDDTPLVFNAESNYYQTASASTNFGCSFTVDGGLTNLTTLSILDSSGEVTFANLLTDAKIYVNDVESSCTLTKVENKAQMTIQNLSLKAGDKVQVVWSGRNVIHGKEGTLNYSVRLS